MGFNMAEIALGPADFAQHKPTAPGDEDRFTIYWSKEQRAAAEARAQAIRDGDNRYAAPVLAKQAARRAADAALRTDVGTTIPAELWQARSAAYEAWKAAQEKAQAAYKELAAHQELALGSNDDVDQWAQTRSALEHKHGALEQRAASAKADYIIAASRILSAVREEATARQATHKGSDVSARIAAMRAEANRLEAEHTSAGAALGRFLSDLDKHGIGLFEEGT